MMSDGKLVDCGNGVHLERGVRCRLSDAITLVSDHYYPSGPSPQPTLLMRQPYGRDIASTVVYAHPIWFARHGYNVVIQDVRGRGDSEGDFYPFLNEGKDGAETIAWLRSRSECNGSIGMYGFSYQGATQLLAAAQQPAGLKCISPAMTACDLYHGWFYQHGALQYAVSLGWGLQLLKSDVRRKKLREASERLEQAWSNLAGQYGFLPFREHPALHGEGVPQYVLDWFDHDQPDEYWSQLDVSQLIDRIAVPALHISGWYDIFLRGSVDGFLQLRSKAANHFARQNQYLIAGPWQHIPWGDRIGASDFGPQALVDTDKILLRWFNHWLKDSKGFAREPHIRHFVLGENQWHHAEDFVTEENYILYAHSLGNANSRRGDGSLSTLPPSTDEPCDAFVCDPEVPVPAPGGASGASGQFDQAGLELGNNVLVFTTAPLIEPVSVFGSPRIVLYAATSMARTDFVVKLVRVRPNGAAEFICLGIARSNWLFRKKEFLADTVQEWDFSLEPTSCRFAPQDRIRLEIASGAFPLYDRNPGGEVPSPRATSWDWRRSTQNVFHNTSHPTALYLPTTGTPS
jgi:putative CocE/NonD family hydrolase